MNPITIAVSKIRCEKETAGGMGADEPYIVVFTANMTTLPPSAEATLYGPWNNVDAGETHVTLPIPPGLPPELINTFSLFRRNCWGTDRKPAVIRKPSDVIILVGLMEHDDGNPAGVPIVVQSFLFASLLSTMNSGISRSSLLSKLKEDMTSALSFSSRGWPSSDDLVGSVKELALTDSDLSNASQGSASKSLNFGGEGSKYVVFFDLKKG